MSRKALVRQSVVLVALGLLSWPHVARAVHLNVPSFKQCDSRWRNDQLGTCTETMCSAGCAVTSTAMVFQYFGGTMTPGELNQCLTNNGGYARGCLIRWINNCMPSGVQWGGTPTSIDSVLNQGYPVIAEVQNQATPEHFVVIVGNDNGEYQINDPYFDYQTISEAGYTIKSTRYYTGNVTPPQPCDVVLSEQDPTIIDDQDPCFSRHGQWWWDDNSGYANHHYYTYTIDEPTHDCWAQWKFEVPNDGAYEVEVYIPNSNADSTRARYTINRGPSEEEVRVDQSASANKGWYSLGVFSFTAGQDRYIALHDNTGEPYTNSSHIPLAFDAVRLTPATQPEPDAAVPVDSALPDAEADAASAEDAGSVTTLDAGQRVDAAEATDGALGGDAQVPQEGVTGGCSCSSTPKAPPLVPILLLGLVLVMRRQRRHHG